MAARVGVVEVAAHQVASQLWLLLALIVDALAVAAQALIARALGRGAATEARAIAARLLQLGLALGTVLAVLFLVLGPVVPRLFTAEAEVIAAVASVMPFVALMQPLNGLVFVWDGVFMGLEDFGFLAVAMLLSAAAAAAVLALVLPLAWGLAGVWWAIAVLTVARVATLAWRHRRWRGGGLEAAG